MSVETLNLVQIYEKLFEGKTLELKFSTKEEMHLFRIRLHQVKQKQERDLVGIGILAEEERQQLKFTSVTESVSDGCPSLTYQIKLLQKLPKQQFTVEILG